MKLTRVWPVPALAASAVLLVAGVISLRRSAPGPDRNIPMKAAQELMDGEHFEEAIEQLNGPVRAVLRDADPAFTATFFVTRARAIYRAQQKRGVDYPQNHQAVLDDFARARELGAHIEGDDRYFLCDSLASLGRASQAMQESEPLRDDHPELRRRLVKRVVERDLRSPSPHFEQTLALLSGMLEDPSLTADDRAWVVARQAELRLDSGFSDEAVTRLMRQVQRLDDASPQRRGELAFILGRALHASGHTQEAREQLTIALSLLDASDPVRGEVQVLLGSIDQANNRLEEARDRYGEVAAAFSSANVYYAAIRGLAETEAGLGNDETALEAYTVLVEGMQRAGPEGLGRRDITTANVTTSLMDRHAERYLRKNFTPALAYLELARRLHPSDQAPDDLVLALAETHRAMAMEVLDEARSSMGRPIDVTEASAVTQQEIKRHALEAGERFREHARRVVIRDNDAYARSLWNAGESFDLAGDLDEALKVFGDYAQSASDDDPRRAEARFRLARVYQSRNEYATAAESYRQLLNLNSGRSGTGAAGSGDAGVGGGVGAGETAWRDASIVPLAHCLLLDDEAANDAEAEQLLRGAIDGTRFGPEAREYRDALVELASHCYRAERYAEAIEHFAEALERFPSDPEADTLRFRYADSNRLSAGQIARALMEAMPQSQRLDLERTRVERLRRGQAQFALVQESLAASPPASRTRLDDLHLRNAAFYLADCAYDLGDYDAAVRAYDSARQKYPNDPASLVAMVQIASAYVEQGQWAKARTANQRAKQHFQSVPDEVWSSADLPMERKHWERWLNAASRLEKERTDASASSAPAAQ